ncbi:MAG: DUF2116 family Zn-ribbon domain-containing protein [Sphaerochaetaceae bacterium]|nr:DUF2116 family Zn-ribbon domain-containing protein [Sphaerochaetaceae bacterium]
MTNTTKRNEILNLHTQGLGIREISRKTGVPKSTVSRLCSPHLCLMCHKPIKLSKKFCSDSCRYKYHNNNKE